MAHERTWIEKHRDVDTCGQFLISFDANSRQRRAERLSLETQIELPVDYRMPNWTSHMLDEAGGCFMNGLYTGCIASLAASVEHGLRELCQGKTLELLISAGVVDGFINDGEEEILTELRKYRNNMIHAKIANLSAGVKLQTQRTALTESGMNEGPWSEEFEPHLPHEKESAASLSAESKVGELFHNVRIALYDIFDRAPSVAK